MSTYEQDVLDSLTDEEREALKEDDGGGTATTTTDDAGGGNDDAASTGNDNKGGDDGKDQQGDKGVQDGKTQAGDDAAAAAAAAEEAAAAGAGNGNGTGTVEQPAGDADAGTSSVKEPAGPVLVASAPADADARLKAIGDEKETLLKQVDDGDITLREYQTRLDALNKDERAIERAVEKAQLANEMKVQQDKNTWRDQVQEFTGTAHPEYSTSRSRWVALDTYVKELATDQANSNLTGPQILAKAHEMVLADLGEAPAKGDGTKKDEPGKPLKGAKIVPPKTLGKVPAADNQEIGDGKFAALDRLADTDPLALEDKLMKMSDADRDEYLASRG